MDHIAEKIRISEYRINNGKALWVLPLVGCPLVIAAGGFMCGVIIQSYANLPKILLVGVSAVILLLAAGIYFLPKRQIIYGAVILFAACCLSGSLRVYFVEHNPYNHINSIVTIDSVLAEITGVVISERIIKPAAVSAAEQIAPKTAPPARYSAAFYLKLDGIKSNGGIVPAKGTVYARISSIPEHAKDTQITEIGQRIKLYCTLSRPKPAKEKWQFDFHRYLQTKMISVCAYAKYPAVVTLESNVGRAGIGKRLAAKLAFILAPRHAEDDAEGLLAALVLGRRTNLEQHVRQAFTDTGLMHILSLSGMHVAIVCGGVWWLVKLMGFRRRAAACVMLAATLFFMYVIPATSPSIRACSIAITFAAAMIFSRKPSPINTLALAVIITLAINPKELLTAGWQLSFGCVISMILLTRPISQYIHHLTGYRFVYRYNDRIIDRKKIVSGIILAVSGSAAAYIGSFGLIILHFGAVYPYSGIWTTLLAIPLSITINLSMLTIVIGSICAPAGEFLSDACRYLSSFLISSVELFAKAPYTEILTGYPPAWAIALLYTALILWAAGVFILNKPLKHLATLCIAMIAVWLVVWNYTTYNKNDLRITFLPVGHGQSVLVEHNRQAIMIDCGSSTVQDCGQRIAKPFLRSRRITRLDAVIVTHPHSDHINGLDYIIPKYRPAAIYVNSDYPANVHDNITIINSNTVASQMSGYKVEILAPFGSYKEENDRSLITIITFNDTKILIPADIEKDRQNELLQYLSANRIKIDTLVMPHHGSKITTRDDFADRINPRHIIPATPESMMEPITIEIKGEPAI